MENSGRYGEFRFCGKREKNISLLTCIIGKRRGGGQGVKRIAKQAPKMRFFVMWARTSKNGFLINALLHAVAKRGR